MPGFSSTTLPGGCAAARASASFPAQLAQSAGRCAKYHNPSTEANVDEIPVCARCGLRHLSRAACMNPWDDGSRWDDVFVERERLAANIEALVTVRERIIAPLERG